MSIIPQPPLCPCRIYSNIKRVMFIFACLLAVFILRVQGQGKWEFFADLGLPGMLAYGRLDPILAPGAVSQHVHMIQGANGMSATYDYDTLRADSSCSTIEVQQDLSNYWAPAMYHYDGASNYTLMLAKFFIYYQFETYSYDPNNKNGSNRRYPFPEGLVMLAGNAYQRSVNLSDPASTAAEFTCQRASGNSPSSHDMRDFQKSGVNCDQSLRGAVIFPSCWDGVADNFDLTHVTYPGFGYVCPQSHPYAFMRLAAEWYWPVQNFPFDSTRTDNWVLAFGDTSGYGFHSDFVNGWNITLLEQAIASCNVSENSIENCPPFSPWNQTQIPPCMPKGLYPNEPVGLGGKSLTALPGCNKLWTDNSTKPTCATVTTPKINLQYGPNLSKWNYHSCPLLFQNGGFILSAKSKTGIANMTVDTCLAQCSGYKYAMMENGVNCYCDNVIHNNGSIVSDPVYGCTVRCPGQYLQFCGGLGSGQLYEACTGTGCLANVVSV